MKAVFEKVDFHEGSSIATFNIETKAFDGPWHFHPEFELTLILKSTGIRYVGNDISNFEVGDLVLVGPNLPHCWVNETNHLESAAAIVVQWLPQAYYDIPEFREINELLSAARRGLRFESIGHKEVISLMQRMVGAAPIDRFLSLTRILSNLAGGNPPKKLAGPSYEPDLSLNVNDRIAEVHRFVRTNFARKIKLRDVASELNMSEQAFSRFFSKVMGRPFFVFLNEYRCNMAGRLLLETDLHAAEIGYRCGYESPSFFYQQFKKFKHYTPMGFRKMYRRLAHQSA